LGKLTPTHTKPEKVYGGGWLPRGEKKVRCAIQRSGGALLSYREKNYSVKLEAKRGAGGVMK